MLSTYVMECARRGFVLPAEKQHLEMIGMLRQRYQHMFSAREDAFLRIHAIVRKHLAEVIYELRIELRNILGNENLTQSNLYYTPADLVQCRYMLRSETDIALDTITLRNADAINSRFLAL